MEHTFFFDLYDFSHTLPVVNNNIPNIKSTALLLFIFLNVWKGNIRATYGLWIWYNLLMKDLILSMYLSLIWYKIWLRPINQIIWSRFNLITFQQRYFSLLKFHNTMIPNVSYQLLQKHLFSSIHLRFSGLFVIVNKNATLSKRYVQVFHEL